MIMEKKYRIAFIGAGNMAQAILQSQLQAGTDPSQIILASPRQEKLSQLAEKYSTKVTSNNSEAIEFADIIVLAVKPQMLTKIKQDFDVIHPKENQLIISVMAGATIDMIKKTTGYPKQQIIRTMPNMPALLQQGMTAIYSDTAVSEKFREIASAMMSPVGDILWLQEENDINKATAISGSGPAYFFLLFEQCYHWVKKNNSMDLSEKTFLQKLIHKDEYIAKARALFQLTIDALQNAGQALGLSSAQAAQMASITGIGALQLAAQSECSVSVLREQVTSKGGTTAAALNVLMAFPWQAFLSAYNEHDACLQYKACVLAAVNAAYQRASQLSMMAD